MSVEKSIDEFHDLASALARLIIEESRIKSEGTPMVDATRFVGIAIGAAVQVMVQTGCSETLARGLIESVVKDGYILLNPEGKKN